MNPFGWTAAECGALLILISVVGTREWIRRVVQKRRDR
jgi:hypothetical protein